MKSTPRSSLSTSLRKLVRAKTHGRCHVCGGPLDRRWQADHVVPLHQGGRNREENYLPACWTCNRVRWHYNSKVIRRILRLGAYARTEVRHGTKLGLKLKALYWRRLDQNKSRRKPGRR